MSAAGEEKTRPTARRRGLARDTKLDRDVAIKVLPETMVRDPERVLRFEREAKLLASLNRFDHLRAKSPIIPG